jgi:hypothetical protein
MEMMIFFFESAANGLALSTTSDGRDLRAEHGWRKVKELRLNRPSWQRWALATWRGRCLF